MRRFTIMFPILTVILLFSVAVTRADMKVTAVLNGYDYAQDDFQSGNVAAWLDDSGNRWQSWYHELNFDTHQWANACAGGLSTRWAGALIISLYHTDNSPAGAPGFQETRNWQLVSTPPTMNLSPTADTSGSEITVTSQDVNDGGAGCGGNCQDRIVTTVFVNTDTDCDGTQNVGGENLYIYWETRLPNLSDTPRWTGNIQARIGDISGTGDKTVNVNIFGPNAIETTDFSGQAPTDSSFLFVVIAILIVLIFLTGIVIQSRRQN